VPKPGALLRTGVGSAVGVGSTVGVGVGDGVGVGEDGGCVATGVLFEGVGVVAGVCGLGLAAPAGVGVPAAGEPVDTCAGVAVAWAAMKVARWTT
jgi:hypothetical protein